jgi:hypothetical protein
MSDCPFLKKGPVKRHYLLVEGDPHVAVSVIASYCILFHGATAPGGPGPPKSRSFTIKLRHTTLGRTTLDDSSVRHRDLSLTPHNTHKRQISMPPVGFEPAIPASERQQTYSLDRAATGTSTMMISILKLSSIHCILRDLSFAVLINIVWVVQSRTDRWQD